jgi:hypothetical protein
MWGPLDLAEELLSWGAMKNIKNRSFCVFGSALGLLALSACVQPESSATTSKQRLLSQSAGPLTISSDQTAKKDSTTSETTSTDSFCKTSEGNESLSQIGDGAEALFQILQTDPSDQSTIHERASHLVGIETAYSKNFVTDCAASGLTAENTTSRIEKLTQLSTETDAAVIHALARDTWDLFNPNINFSTDGMKSSPNPFADPATN